MFYQSAGVSTFTSEKSLICIWVETQSLPCLRSRVLPLLLPNGGRAASGAKIGAKPNMWVSLFRETKEQPRVEKVKLECQNIFCILIKNVCVFLKVEMHAIEPRIVLLLL